YEVKNPETLNGFRIFLFYEVYFSGLSMIGRFLHIDVESLEKGDEEVVEINIPLNVAKSFLKLGFVQNQINEKVGTDVAVDIDEITRLIDLDFVGDLVMVDTKDAKVRIWID
ncbi:hypothetical protein, partial [Turicibacter sanguinis]|uniref:hypothetical protein n=1 Tax=Turicibacter sanguinis TaxID=154288 RepID=UPI001E4732A9